MHARFERLCGSNLTLIFVSLFTAIWILSGCSSFTINDPSYFTAISAASGTIRVNQQIQLISNAKATGVPLIYYVNGISGGNAELGTVDGNGLYTAPAIVPIPNTVQITSIASKFPSYPPGSVSLGVLNPIPILTSVTPSGFSEGTTTVTVNGSQFVYGVQILWNGIAVPTTFVSGTQLVAAIAAPEIKEHSLWW